MNEQVINSSILDGASGDADFNTYKRKKTFHFSWKRFAIYLALAIYTLWLMAPFMIIIVTSFTTRAEWNSTISYIWWPKDFSFEGYERLFTADMGKTDSGIPVLINGFLNTMWITLLPLVSGLFQSLLVSYCYWQQKFPFKNSLFMFTVTLMFVPLGAFGFVSYMFYKLLGWTEGLAAFLPMVVPGLFASAGTVFFLRPYLDGIGGEIVEAAKIDGMGFWQIFFTIVIPLSKPALIAQFIFGFVGGYNNYAGALMYVGDDNQKSMWTLQIALQKTISNLSAEGGSDYGFLCASSLLSMLPLIIVYLCCQKFFIEGITFGGGKE